MKNRYIFFKRLFKDYVILFSKNSKYYSLGIDKFLKKYINNKDLNYVVIDKENRVEVHTFKINNYKMYVMKIFIEELLIAYIVKNR